jgi:hypothetical protein
MDSKRIIGGHKVINYPVDMTVTPEIEAFFDDATNTISYIVKDSTSDACAIIDSVMDIDYAAWRITYDHADAMISRVKKDMLTGRRYELSREEFEETDGKGS